MRRLSEHNATESRQIHKKYLFLLKNLFTAGFKYSNMVRRNVSYLYIVASGGQTERILRCYEKFNNTRGTILYTFTVPIGVGTEPIATSHDPCKPLLPYLDSLICSWKPFYSSHYALQPFKNILDLI